MSVNTSSSMELSSEQYPDEEQDRVLDELGMEESRIKEIWGRTGKDEGFSMVAS